MKPEPEDPRTLEAASLLEAALRPGVLDPAAEERALRAFRAARDAGSRPAPVRWRRRRRRDDWRPAGERRRQPSLKALVAGVVAVVAVGGVAVAAGEGAIPSPFGGGAEPKPGRSAPTAPGADTERAGDGRGERVPERSARPTRSAANDAPPLGRPGTAQDTAAHCRVYLAAVERRGTAPRGAAMARLELAVGGAAAVPAYCERLLAAERKRPGSRPADGRPAEGDPADEKSAAGNPADGKPAAGNPAGGDPAEGKPAGEDAGKKHADQSGKKRTAAPARPGGGSGAG